MAANDCVNCVDKCERMGNPEYQKCYKPQHNSACSCGFGTLEEETDTSNKTIIRQNFVREDFL